MPTTPDNTATTWRDLADQLSESERASIEQMEAGGVPEHVLLMWARDYVDYHLADIAYGDVPLPEGARTDSTGWSKNTEGGGYSRSLTWRTFDGPSNISVDIDGRQECDGSFTRQVSLWGTEEGGALTADQARAIAGLLLEAADEMDRLNG